MSYQLLPPLAQDEYAALRDSIATFGILQPVLVDEAGEVIDGHHRKQIADELGLTCPTVTLPGLSEEQKLEQALVLNLARRHLTPEQRRQLVADLRGRGLSIRFISEKTGIPRSTVHRFAGGVPSGTPEYVTGTDGKRYAAHRPDDALERWRHVWEDAGAFVPATTGPEFRRWAAAAFAELGAPDADGWRDHAWTKEEKEAIRVMAKYERPLTAWPTPHDVVDGEDAMWQDLLLEALLPSAGAVLIHSGKHLPPPPWLLARYDQSWRMSNAIKEWEIRIEREAGRFLGWCEDRGFKLTGAGWSLPEKPLAVDMGYWFCYVYRRGDHAA